MIRTLSAFTEEIDDVEAAVEEILGQLDLAGNLLKNTIGIITCHYEFIFTGVAKALCQKLPFEVMGTITSAQAVNGNAGALLLTLLVITSDEISFQTVVTDSLLGDAVGAVEEGYRAALSGRPEKPALIVAYGGFMVENSGDDYVNAITRVSNGVPCFGTLSVDDTADFQNCFMLYNGEYYRDRLGMILFYGDLHPRFHIATISDDKIIDRAALVTSSQGHILKEVNGRPVVEYFEDLGLAKASETSYAMTSLPFMLDYNDGTPPVSKVFIGLNEEKHAICAGAMPEGSTLYIGVFDKDDVLLTTRNAVQAARKEMERPSCILIYSCISRSMSLGSEQLGELNMIQELVGETPFLMAYSGGEMCPTQNKDSQAVNRFHNNAFVLCAF